MAADVCFTEYRHGCQVGVADEELVEVEIRELCMQL